MMSFVWRTYTTCCPSGDICGSDAYSSWKTSSAENFGAAAATVAVSDKANRTRLREMAREASVINVPWKKEPAGNSHRMTGTNLAVEVTACRMSVPAGEDGARCCRAG